MLDHFQPRKWFPVWFQFPLFFVIFSPFCNIHLVSLVSIIYKCLKTITKASTQKSGVRGLSVKDAKLFYGFYTQDGASIYASPLSAIPGVLANFYIYFLLFLTPQRLLVIHSNMSPPHSETQLTRVSHWHSHEVGRRSTPQ